MNICERRMVETEKEFFLKVIRRDEKKERREEKISHRKLWNMMKRKPGLHFKEFRICRSIVVQMLSKVNNLSF